MTCSPEANQITASKLLKWSLRTHSLSLSLCLCGSLALFLIMFSNLVQSFFLIMALNLFVPPFIFSPSLLSRHARSMLFFSTFFFLSAVCAYLFSSCQGQEFLFFFSPPLTLSLLLLSFLIKVQIAPYRSYTAQTWCVHTPSSTHATKYF